MGGNVEVENGSNLTSSFIYDSQGNINGSMQNVVYSYEDFEHHSIGYWLAIASAIGMVGVIVSLRRTYKENE